MTRKKIIIPQTQTDFTFEVVEGFQCRSPYWMSTLTVAQIKQMFVLDRPPGTHPLDIAQRMLQRTHYRKIAKYILDGLLPENGFYILPAVTVGIKATDFEFSRFEDSHSSGILTVPYDAEFYTGDGQHRQKSMLEAALEAPAMMDGESIGVMFKPDPGGIRQRQVFLHLNRSLRPNKSLITLFDECDDLAQIARMVMVTVPVFVDHTAFEATSIKATSPNELFSLNALRDSCKLLVRDCQGDRLELALAFWDAVGKHQPDWVAAIQPGADLSQLKRDRISFHAITLNTLGVMGATLVREEGWQQKLQGLDKIDWDINNPDWKNLFMIEGRGILKTTASYDRFASYLLGKLGLA